MLKNKHVGLSVSEVQLNTDMDGNSVSNYSGHVELDAMGRLSGLGSNDFTLQEDEEDDTIKPSTCILQAGKLCQKVCHRIKRGCTKKMLFRRLPPLTWAPKYNTQDFVGDLVAGITVGLTVIPQSLAYSNIANMPAQYGMYGSFLGAMVYIMFGSCRSVPMGPTAIVSLLTFQALSTIQVARLQHAVLLCFFTGVIQLGMGIFGLGFIIDFVSGPVSSGFTSAVALIIVTSQVKDVLGITASGSTFIDMWISLFQNMSETRVWDAVLGFVCIIILLLMRLVANIEVGPAKNKTMLQTIVTKSLWLFGTSRNAILVILCGCIGFYISETSTSPSLPFKIMGEIPSGLPDAMAPPFFAEDATTNVTVSFNEMMSNLGSNLIILPLIGMLENIAICKAFSSGAPVDATQEMIAIGLCNIGNSFVQAFPGSGSLSRSAVNEASGVRTPLGGLYTGVLVIVALLFFTPYFYYIPKATLAAIIIAAVVFMVEVRVVKPMWRTKKSDLIPGFGTFIACLVLKLEIGIAIGIIIQILFLLHHAARPKIHMQKLKTSTGIDYLRLTPDRCLIFPSVDYVRNIVTKHSLKQGIPVVIDCSHVYGADFTAAKVIESLSHDFVQRKQPLFFYNLKSSVVSVFEGLQPKEFVCFYEHDDLDSLIQDAKSGVV